MIDVEYVAFYVHKSVMEKSGGKQGEIVAINE
jgi:hypothetical protein